MKFLRRVWRILSRGDVTKTATRQDQILLLRRAIARNERRRMELAFEWRRESGLCCLSCWSSEYRWLIDKTDRQEAWLAILEAK